MTPSVAAGVKSPEARRAPHVRDVMKVVAVRGSLGSDATRHHTACHAVPSWTWTSPFERDGKLVLQPQTQSPCAVVEKAVVVKTLGQEVVEKSLIRTRDTVGGRRVVVVRSR
jgi:hypothetical protein